MDDNSIQILQIIQNPEAFLSQWSYSRFWIKFHWISFLQGDEFESRKTSGTSSEYGEEDLEALRVQALEQLNAAQVSLHTYCWSKLVSF